MPALFLLNFVRFLLIGLEILIFARILLSWFDPSGRSPVASFIIQTTEPLLGPIRKLLPRTGMFDFSPLIVLLLLGVILRAVG